MTTACVFPGQGSQSIAMSSALAADFPVVIDVYKEASDALGFDLWALVSEGSKEALNQTHNTQPAMLAAAYAVWRLLQSETDLRIDFLAGHSLGEYTALVCAESIGFADAITLVCERGQLMQQAVPAGEGAMAAILGLDDAAVMAVCEQVAQGDVVSAVNFNSPGQVVIAGQKTAVERAMLASKEAGAKRALALPVSVPSHCALMKSAAEKLALRLESIQINSPIIPVVHNVDVQSYTEAGAIRQALVAQLYSPVQWANTIHYFMDNQVSTVIESGPGKVLTGLCKRINKEINNIAVYDSKSLKALIESFNA